VSSQTLQVDRDAREFFNRCAIAAGMNDGDAALEVCREAAEIEKHYRLSLRVGADAPAEKQPGDPPFEGRPAAGPLPRMDAKFPGRCGKCSAAISVGMAIAYDGEARRAFHERCAP
jgi:hypothetical protein